MTGKRYSFDEFSKIIIDILDEKDGVSTSVLQYLFEKKTGRYYDVNVIRQKLHRMVDEGLIKSTYDVKGYKWWKIIEEGDLNED